ncbi:hypothetical protein SLEP1_g38704 [Rubroshorea leprosula]|uniref:Uncharacterized protein n=1 Tax=Rubroshorea leprosula TaxID=152421 RepID=A0AAV5KYA8_9ROSI|nr:hypothetical protein SLEP1_g38704 [Rubroshorea leprosula]
MRKILHQVRFVAGRHRRRKWPKAGRREAFFELRTLVMGRLKPLFFDMPCPLRLASAMVPPPPPSSLWITTSKILAKLVSGVVDEINWRGMGIPAGVPIPRRERGRGAKSAPPKKIPAGFPVPMIRGDGDGDGDGEELPGPAGPVDIPSL